MLRDLVSEETDNSHRFARTVRQSAGFRIEFMPAAAGRLQLYKGGGRSSTCTPSMEEIAKALGRGSS